MSLHHLPRDTMRFLRQSALRVRDGTPRDALVSDSEYGKYLARGGRLYSEGHRRMYDGPIRLLAGSSSDILDVGFGIGYGLEQMTKHRVIGSYVGYEPSKDSFDFVAKQFGRMPNIKLRHAPFGEPDRTFDYVFCIEVIEHVSDHQRSTFVGNLRKATGKTLFLSTPDRQKVPQHGVFTEAELKTALRAAGFSTVILLSEQWTSLYIAQ